MQKKHIISGGITPQAPWSSKVKAKVEEISSSLILGIGLLILALCILGISLMFHKSLFAIVLTWVMFFSSAIGGWIIGQSQRK